MIPFPFLKFFILYFLKFIRPTGYHTAQQVYLPENPLVCAQNNLPIVIMKDLMTMAGASCFAGPEDHCQKQLKIFTCFPSEIQLLLYYVAINH